MSVAAATNSTDEHRPTRGRRGAKNEQEKCAPLMGWTSDESEMALEKLRAQVEQRRVGKDGAAVTYSP